MPELPNPQYHHFVPQFLLRNFAHKYKPPKAKEKTSKRRRPKYKKGMYPGDTVVRHVDLTVDPYAICEKPVSRILGMMDMYRDTSKPTPNQQHVEEMLSKLESRASTVFVKITKAYESRQAGVWLTRHERDVVRKFLFILKYRGSTFHYRFYHESPDTYDSNDRPMLLDYMREKGFQRPIDVWFDNLKTIIELDMDPEKKWVHTLQEKMFRDDAMWFVIHTQAQYMAICTPQDAASEFVLTDNSYHVFEGPNTFLKDEKTGEVHGSTHTPLHEFAPVSPKLMIVLRSMLLPVPEEDFNEEHKRWRDEMRALALDNLYPWDVKSLLDDLPITKPRNNYSTIVGGRVRPLQGEDGTGRSSHKFLFKFFPIETRHVNIINGIFLDNAVSHCTSIVFESEAAFRSTIEWFMTAPPRSVGKICLNHASDPRFGGLRKLEALSRSLGSDKELVWEMLDLPFSIDYEAFMEMEYQRRKLLDRLVKEEVDDDFDLEKSSLGVGYEKLGGNKSTLDYDIKQSICMWQLRVKIDVWSQGIDERIRQRNRELLVDAYLRLPPQRVWLYVKLVRIAFMEKAFKANVGEMIDLGEVLSLDHPEDVIARVSHIIKPEKVARLLHQITLNDCEIKTKLQPDIGRDPLSFLQSAMGQMMFHYKIAFHTPGYIRDCGISEVEQLAASAQRDIIRHRLWDRPLPFPFVDEIIDEGDKIEMVTRIIVKARFIDALKEKLETELLEELCPVFFDVAYPTVDFEPAPAMR